MTNLLTRKPRFLFLFAASILHLFSFPSMAAKLQDHPEKQNEESFSWTGITVEQLAAACKETVENKTSSTLDCFSYMDGFLDGYALASGLDKDELEFCLPKNPTITKNDIATLFLHLAKSPDRSEDPAFLLFAAMLGQAFPCDSQD